MKTVFIMKTNKESSLLFFIVICFVGIVDMEGNPYVVPMNFGYEDGIIYLHSGPEGSKSWRCWNTIIMSVSLLVSDAKLVYQHEKVACSYSMRSESAMCRGKVEFVEDMEEKRGALDIIMCHYTHNEFNYSDPAVRNVKVESPNR